MKSLSKQEVEHTTIPTSLRWPFPRVTKPGATHITAPDIMVFLDHEGDHVDCGRWGSGNSILGADARVKATIL